MDPAPATPSELRETARGDFPKFYRTASATDAWLMDGLVTSHAALVMLTNVPREHMEPTARTELERTTTKVEQSFTQFREAVRACPTFAALSVGEQLAIERVLLNVRPPLSS